MRQPPKMIEKHDRGYKIRENPALVARVRRVKARWLARRKTQFWRRAA